MDEQEYPLIQITDDDIRQANQLSLHCPICAGAVERNLDEPALTPVVCAQCKTLYHRACWEQSGGKCAVLGCGHNEYYNHGADVRPTLTIKYTDLPTPALNGHSARRNKQLKAEQKRQVEALRRPGFWQRLWQWLLDQIKIE